MSEFLTYKKVSDLEQVNSPLEGATIPFLDGDGIVKRISADGFTSGGSGGSGGSGSSGGSGESIAPVFFRRSGNVMHYGPSGTNVTIDEFTDAFFNGNGYFLKGDDGFEDFEKIVSFRISGRQMEKINSYTSEVSIPCTDQEMTDAINKYKTANKSVSYVSKPVSDGPVLFTRSGNIMHYETGIDVTADEFMDAFFNGKAYLLSGVSGGQEEFEQIVRFRLSANSMVEVNNYKSGNKIISTTQEMANAINKYKPQS